MKIRFPAERRGAIPAPESAGGDSRPPPARSMTPEFVAADNHIMDLIGTVGEA